MQTFFITFDNTFEAANFKTFVQEFPKIQIKHFNFGHCQLNAPNDTFASIAYTRGILINSIIKVKYIKHKVTKYITLNKSYRKEL